MTSPRLRRHICHLLGTACLLLVSGPISANWSFAEPVDLTAGVGVFPHLDASGRQALAVSAEQVAVAWDDARDQSSHCRVALRPSSGVEFRQFRVGGEECYAPAVTALGDGRFGVIWEDEAGIGFTHLDQHGPAQILRLAARGSHASLAWHAKLGLFATWSGNEGRHARVQRSHLAWVGDGYRAGPAQSADSLPQTDDQLYPVLAASRQGIALVWEDRRHGHTVIYASVTDDGQAWTAPRRVSGNPTGKAPGTDLGRGTGAMRPALAGFGAGRLAAVWLDKRDFLSGYDVYAALSNDGGKTFAKDGKAQDSFGDAIAQWHAAVAGNERGDLVVAWDDERDGNADVWLAWLQADGSYADNISPAPAHGPNGQSDPAIALDAAGNLHLAWIERDAGGAARLRYSLGRLSSPRR